MIKEKINKTLALIIFISFIALGLVSGAIFLIINDNKQKVLNNETKLYNVTEVNSYLDQAFEIGYKQSESNIQQVINKSLYDGYIEFNINNQTITYIHPLLCDRINITE